MFNKGANSNCIIFGLRRPELEPMVYRTPGDHAKNYTTGVLQCELYPVAIWIFGGQSANLGWVPFSPSIPRL